MDFTPSLNAKNFFRFTGPPENWLTAIKFMTWGLEEKYLSRWKEIQTGDGKGRIAPSGPRRQRHPYHKRRSGQSRSGWLNNKAAFSGSRQGPAGSKTPRQKLNLPRWQTAKWYRRLWVTKNLKRHLQIIHCGQSQSFPSAQVVYSVCPAIQLFCQMRIKG